MDSQALDRKIARLQEKRSFWLKLPLGRRIDYLPSALRGTQEIAEHQVRAALSAKGITPGTPPEAEEWLSGPVSQVRVIRTLLESLEYLAAHGELPLDTSKVRVRGNGQVVVEVFPSNTLDKVIYRGLRAEVWMQPHVTPENLRENMGKIYRSPPEQGKVALVLGAGNVAAIGPLDVIHKLYCEVQVCLLKFNPANDYTGFFLEQAFAELIRDGFVATAYGGADVGRYLCHHDGIEEIHITGSHRTHDVIVWGSGEEGATNRENGRPRLQKRVTSELGNVSPVIVVPGNWSPADLRYHAENAATQMVNNSGFNCNAARVIILHEGWRQKNAFMDALRGVLGELPPRRAYYPGAEDRWKRFVSEYDNNETIGEKADGLLPWTLLPDLDARTKDNLAFRTESFCCLMAQTSLPGNGAADFFASAVRFANEVLWGTLNAGIIIDPETQRSMGPSFEQAIADLRYGTIAINAWAALAFALGQTPWGAYPGHTLEDIQSGIGVVHNTRLFDTPQKGVIYAPFRVEPKPLWFVTHRNAHVVAPKLAAFEAKPSVIKLPGVFLQALRGQFL